MLDLNLEPRLGLLQVGFDGLYMEILYVFLQIIGVVAGVIKRRWRC